MFPLSFVPVTILPGMHSVAFCLRVSPLPYVGVSWNASPDSIAMLQTLVPFTVIDLPVVPCVDTLPMRLPVLEKPKVGIGVGIPFEATAVSHVVVPLPFVLPSIPVSHHSLPITFTILIVHLPHKHGWVLISLLLVARQIFQGL